MNDIVYIEIPLVNVVETIQFYQQLFGWNIQRSELDDTEYYPFNTPNNSLEGAFDAQKTPSKDGTFFYVRVKSIERVLATLRNAFGNQMIVEERTLIHEKYGYRATIQDPSNNRIGLLEYSEVNHETT